MTETCASCDFIGPDRFATTSAVRDVHRAVHDTYRAFVIAFEPLAAAVREASDRERQVTQDAYVLVSESIAASLRGER